MDLFHLRFKIIQWQKHCLKYRLVLPSYWWMVAWFIASISQLTPMSPTYSWQQTGQCSLIFIHVDSILCCFHITQQALPAVKDDGEKIQWNIQLPNFIGLKKTSLIFFFLIFFTSANLWSYDSWQICYCKVTHLAYIWTGLYSAIYGRCYSTVDNKTDILCAIWHINRIQLGTVGKQTDTFNMLFYIVRIQLDTIAL